MVRRTKEAAEETRALILDTAEDMFHEIGVARTSLTDIAARAGVTRGAIYWHFTDKVDLFTAMCDRATLPLEAMFSGVGAENLDDPLASLRASCVGVLRVVAEDARCRRVFEIISHKCEYVDEMAPTMLRRQACRQDAMALIENNLAQAARLGQLPEALDTRRAAFALFAYLDGLVHGWGLNACRGELAEEPGVLIDLFLDGLRGNGRK
jgi:TetR/AcrR family acrAB operon transcriptional repressor